MTRCENSICLLKVNSEDYELLWTLNGYDWVSKKDKWTISFKVKDKVVPVLN